MLKDIANSAELFYVDFYAGDHYQVCWTETEVH